jgi:hypothetical protein
MSGSWEGISRRSPNERLWHWDALNTHFSACLQHAECGVLMRFLLRAMSRNTFPKTGHVL